MASQVFSGLSCRRGGIAPLWMRCCMKIRLRRSCAGIIVGVYREGPKRDGVLFGMYVREEGGILMT